MKVSDIMSGRVVTISQHEPVIAAARLLKRMNLGALIEASPSVYDNTVLIGTCPNPMMACHRVTDPALIVIGVLVALVAAADAWRLSKKA